MSDIEKLVTYSNVLFSVKRNEVGQVFIEYAKEHYHQGLYLMESLWLRTSRVLECTLKVIDSTYVALSSKTSEFQGLSQVPCRWFHMINDFCLDQSGNVESIEMDKSMAEDDIASMLLEVAGMKKIISQACSLSIPNITRGFYVLCVHTKEWYTNDYTFSPLAKRVLHGASKYSCLNYKRYSELGSANGGIRLYMQNHLFLFNTITFNHLESIGSIYDEIRGVNTYYGNQDINLEELVILSEVLRKEGVPYIMEHRQKPAI
jgi:hypothetical protein